MTERTCLQCGESEGAVRASQRARDPIYCAAVDYFGEVEWECDRHRFRDWSNRELIEGWRIKPEHVERYRRIMTGWEIDFAHRLDPESAGSENG